MEAGIHGYNGNFTDCNVCANADHTLGQFIKESPLEMSHHRVEGQSVKCAFGLQGICCRLCANGPCRITPEGPKGVCGADADTIVIRNFLRAVACGSGCYIHVVENAVKLLRHQAVSGTGKFDEKALKRLADMLGIHGSDAADTAVKIADLVEADIYLPSDRQMKLVQKVAYPPRYNKWAELGILPGGAKSEVFDGAVKTSTNLNSDPVDMLVNCLKLGISTGIYGLTLTNLINDIMLGSPELMQVPVGLRVIDPDYINIMVTGHQHAMFGYMQERLKSEEALNIAGKAGAKGFRFVGCTCVGQDMQLRGKTCGDVFSGHAGNNFTSEPILSTGLIDGVISEFNCTLPGIEPICEELKIHQICLDPLAKKANAKCMPLNTEKLKEDTDTILMEMAEAYKKRRGNVPTRPLPGHGNDNTLAGVSEVNLKEFLGGSYKPLIDLIVSGKIKGIAGVVGCSSVAYGHDVLTVALTKELIKKDILVLSAGCSTGGLENCGLMQPEAAELAGDGLKEVCKALGIPPVLNFGPCLAIGRLELTACDLAAELNVDLPDLPLVLSAAQWLEEQALADGAFGLALGLPLHLGVPPFVTGSPVATQVLTEDLKKLTGGRLILEADAKEAADMLLAVILEKRKALGI